MSRRPWRCPGTPLPSPPVSDRLADLFQALAHPLRLRLMELICGHERCLDECAAGIGLSTADAGDHLSQLIAGGCVVRRVEDGRAYYRTRDPRIRELLGLARSWRADRATGLNGQEPVIGANG